MSERETTPAEPAPIPTIERSFFTRRQREEIIAKWGAARIAGAVQKLVGHPLGSLLEAIQLGLLPQIAAELGETDFSFLEDKPKV